MACASAAVAVWGGTPARGIGAYGFLADGHAEGRLLLIFLWLWSSLGTIIDDFATFGRGWRRRVCRRFINSFRHFWRIASPSSD